MEKTISLIDFFKILKHRWKLIVVITLTAAIISSIISFFLLTPLYQASTQILVNQKNSENQLDYYLLQGNVDLINTYSVIIKSPAILQKVIDELELKQSVEDLNEKITIISQENSQVFSLTIEDPDAGKAVAMANMVSEIFQEEIKGIMNVDNVSILARAELKDNPIPVYPRPMLNTSIAFVIGLMIGIGIAFLLELMDNTLKDDQDAAAYLGLPVLGTIEKVSRTQSMEEKGYLIQETGSETLEA
ncbi:YveK family protein [Neobacillus niacini]|uniref:YveK family protein n=1 Tax=Neobacillus niacini TaxID=86668 RepID=UPI0005ED6614|nr:Wzz/FepE/Etk N-terminal domain-containing protein [Neobacillus niacini]